MRVYIAGPMMGYPEHNFPLFNHVADRLRSKGHVVINPVEVGDKHFNNDTSKATPHEFLTKDILELLTCDTICLLPNWDLSCGATCEAVIAKSLGFARLNEFGDPEDWSTIIATKSYGPR